jgi:pyridoxal phosphate enzyme (YggS family)
VAGRVEEIRRRIAAACARAGRDPAAVTLLGAAKLQPVERIAAACAAGLTVIGENRVDEAEAHRSALAALAAAPEARPATVAPEARLVTVAPEARLVTVAWHLIGPLQSNKARRAAALFDAVHSIDRPKIAGVLDRHLAELGRRIPALIEVNLGGEPTKHGFAPAGLAAAVRPLADLEHLAVAGLMAIPPPAADPEGMRPWFRRLRELRDELAARPEWAGMAGWLSMGMSDDFEVAVEEGATHVRIGTALFGPRA